MNGTVLTTAALQSKLTALRHQADQHAQELTQKLALDTSGQTLLHMGTFLQTTLPPDLHSFLTFIHPVLSATEQAEQEQRNVLMNVLTSKCRALQQQQDRASQARYAADLLVDLMAAEHAVAIIPPTLSSTSVEYASRLERAAHVTVMLQAEVKASQQKQQQQPPPPQSPQHRQQNTRQQSINSADTTVSLEYAEFLFKLAPRIRRLENDCVSRLLRLMEQTLTAMVTANSNHYASSNSSSSIDAGQEQEAVDGATTHDPTNLTTAATEWIAILGHAMRGLAITGHGKECEFAFARVAVLPLLSRTLSLGRLDQGGARGSCHGLPTLLIEWTNALKVLSPVLEMAMEQFTINDENSSSMMDVDLLTNGVWSPIVTALSADPAIKLAIFSPGIASILQANYCVLDQFCHSLASSLLSSPSSALSSVQAQHRVDTSPITAGFFQKWNLPIYYQLRFGEASNRLNKIVEQTRQEGWTVTLADEEDGSNQKQSHHGLEIALFQETHDILQWFWRSDVILKPLTNRFLRGAVQVIGRVVTFVQEGIEGKILFGMEEIEPEQGEPTINGEGLSSSNHHLPTRKLYCWGESEQEVAAVTWELKLLESMIRYDYVDTICKAVIRTAQEDDVDEQGAELQTLISEVLKEAADQVPPIIDKAWNEIIVNILIGKCSGPLAAVKGVAATYRMTNRPPPTQASPFVLTILRPLKEFCQEFVHRIPVEGDAWKETIVSAISDRYAVAVEELLATVQRTEAALQNRRARRTAVGSTGSTMSDGEKVKLQVYLDYQAFLASVQSVGVDTSAISGLAKLQELTAEGHALQQQQNGK